MRWAKFWPRGERGVNGGNRDGRFGLVPLAEYTARANAETFIGVQIETPGALDSVAEIAAIPDVDLLFVGPSDLSQVLGVHRRLREPPVPRGDRGDRRSVRGRRQAVGHLLARPGLRRADAEWGCQLFVVAADIHVVHAGIRDVKDRYASFFRRQVISCGK